MTKANGLTNRELLIRIDERQKFITNHLNLVDKRLDKKLDCKEFEPYETKINTIWDDRNKVLGMILLASSFSGIVVFFLGKIATYVFANI